jgi:hypothetical protein
MKTRPSRSFIYLALVMVFLLVIGLIVVGVLASENRLPSQFEQTRNSQLPFNADNATWLVYLMQSETANASFTPITYTADMSPTAPPYFVYATFTAYAETATWIARNTSPTPYYTPTYPYDPELYEMRRREELGLITSGGPTEYARFYMTETALVEAYQTIQALTPTPTPSVTLTPSPTALATFTPGVSIQGCVWQWARQDLPELGVTVLQEFIDLDMPQVEVRVEAYGENCLDPNNSSTVNYFAAMTTDFYITNQVDDLADEDALAEFAVSAYNVVMDLPQESLPARPGYLDITFTAETQSKHFRAMFDEVKAALDDGLSGNDLLEAFGGVQ